MHPSDWKRPYDDDGYVVVRQFLDADELTELRRELDRYIRDIVPGLPDSAAFYEDRRRPETLKQMQHMQGDPFFARFADRAKWKSLAETLVGEPATSDSPEWFDKPPGGCHVTPPHQDNFYFCLQPHHVVTIWLALDQVDTENGCLRYLPGSHRQGFRAHSRSRILGFSQGIVDYGDADRAAEVEVHLEPGDVVAHHGMTVHRADANRSPTRHRRAFAVVYKGQSCRRDEAAYARYRAAVESQHSEFGLKT